MNYKEVLKKQFELELKEFNKQDQETLLEITRGAVNHEINGYVDFDSLKLEFLEDEYDLSVEDFIKYSWSTNDEFYYIEDLDRVLNGYRATRIIKLLSNSDNFNIENKFFKFEGDNKLISFNNPTKFYEIEKVYEYVYKHYQDDYFNSYNINLINQNKKLIERMTLCLVECGY